MKKLLISILITLLVSTGSFADPSDKEDQKDPEKKQQQCPKTLMTESCLACHTSPSFKLKESPIDEAYGEMPSDIDFAMIGNKIDHIVYECETVTPYDFKRMFAYLDQHKELPRKIVINVHSPGGSAFDGLQIINMIMNRWRDYDITTVVDGMAFSAGFMIFNAGEHRICSPHAELMWHEAASWELFRKNTASTLKDTAEVFKHIQTNADEWLASRSKMSADEIKDKITINREGWWMNGKEAYDAGFCDELKRP